MASESSATTVWEGGLEKGRGSTTAASGTLSEVEVTWQARVERTEDTTSPEELLDRKSTRLNSSHSRASRMPSSA